MVYVVTATSYKSENQIPVSVFENKQDAEKFLKSIFEIAKAATIYECPITRSAFGTTMRTCDDGIFEKREPYIWENDSINNMRHVVTTNSTIDNTKVDKKPFGIPPCTEYREY